MTDPVVEKRGPGRPPKAARRLSVIEKRLSGASPFGTESVTIPLKDPDWAVYIGNGARSDRRLWELVNVKGWVPVTVDDLACKPEDFGFTVTPDGHLCTGPKGLEVVFKMPKADYAKLVRAKTEANLKSIGSSAKVKADLANAAATQFGPEAGEFIQQHVHGEVKDWRAPEEL